MINRILTYYTEKLQDYLSRTFSQPEGCAVVGFVGNSSEPKPNKMVVSLLCLDRDPLMGNSSSTSRSMSAFLSNKPTLFMNLDIVLAAIFEEKRYAESLSFLSGTLLFIQSNPLFSFEGVTYTVEVVSLTSQDMNNIWSELGGQYYPSVVCKIRHLAFDAGTGRAGGQISSRPEINTSHD